MSLLPVLVTPDPILRQKAEPVAVVDAAIVSFMADMVETMYHQNGIGLAANQVGRLQRIVVIDLSDSRDGTEALRMVNPEITWKSDEEFTYKEGCLSVPENYAEVTRPQKIRVTYIDQDNKKQKLEAEDLLSICIQHEIDHLNGVLFVDYLSALKRNIILRKVEKACKRKTEQ